MSIRGDESGHGRDVADPASYRWSSCATKVGGEGNGWLDLDPLYLGLAESAVELIRKYRAFLAETISDEEKIMILGAVLRGQLTGGPLFVDEIEQKLARRIELRLSGRPRKSGK